MVNIIQKIFGSSNQRELKRINKLVALIDEQEENLEKLSDNQLQEKTEEFKERYQSGETLDELLVEAYAVVREASKRVLGMRPFPVQMVGGIVLHEGNIAEMKTGEGKTL